MDPQSAPVYINAGGEELSLSDSVVWQRGGDYISGPHMVTAGLDNPTNFPAGAMYETRVDPMEDDADKFFFTVPLEKIDDYYVTFFFAPSRQKRNFGIEINGVEVIRRFKITDSVKPTRVDVLITQVNQIQISLKKYVREKNGFISGLAITKERLGCGNLDVCSECRVWFGGGPLSTLCGSPQHGPCRAVGQVSRRCQPGAAPTNQTPACTEPSMSVEEFNTKSNDKFAFSDKTAGDSFIEDYSRLYGLVLRSTMPPLTPLLLHCPSHSASASDTLSEIVLKSVTWATKRFCPRSVSRPTTASRRAAGPHQVAWRRWPSRTRATFGWQVSTPGICWGKGAT